MAKIRMLRSPRVKECCAITKMVENKHMPLMNAPIMKAYLREAVLRCAVKPKKHIVPNPKTSKAILRKFPTKPIKLPEAVILNKRMLRK